MGTLDSSVTPARRLEGKVAIITGGASGIGASSVRLFHHNGAKLIIADIQDELGKALAAELGPNAIYIHCDVSNEDDVINLVDTAVVTFGKLDIMYNNAGVIDRQFGSILDVTKPDLDKVIAANVHGAFWGAKHAARVMIPKKTGCILFTGSAATATAGLSTHPYAASKYAALGLVKNLAFELGQHGIRVNCVAPFMVATGISGWLDGAMVEKFEAMMSGCGNLRGGVLKAEDVAGAAMFLAGDEAKYVSGVNLLVDGGFSVVNPTVTKALGRIG